MGDFKKLTLILDTNVIINFGEENIDRLGEGLFNELATQPVLVHPVSYYEIIWKHGKGRLRLNKPVDKWIDLLRKIPTLREIKLNWEDFFIAASFDYPENDPMDRLIVAAAKIRGLTIVTSDRTMIDFKGVDTIGF